MRTWLVMGAAALAMAGGIQGAEARGRGFGRLFSGRAPTPYQPAATVSARHRTDPRPAGGISYQPVVAITPGRAAAVAAATTMPAAAVAEELRLSEPAPAPPPAAARQPMQEARAVVAACAPDRRVGSLHGPEGGFCLIN
jgi:hypothetical protein